MHTEDRYFIVRQRHQEREAQAREERLAKVAAEARRARRVTEAPPRTRTRPPTSHRPRLDWLARIVGGLIPRRSHPSARAH
ncbi:MAG TPA: hypothetical protein VLA23_07020 [Candidatus Limnocylindrales bacterium]|nr:hypothetical protein [Candidatus Limnocylindrales bacterium]